MAQVNAYIILHVFCQDDKLKVDQIWLNKRRAFDQEKQRTKDDHAINNQIFFLKKVLREGQQA